MPDSAAIEAALIGKLLGDSALTALCPDGVYFGVAKQSSERFVLVDLLDHHDEAVFGGRAIESGLYLVKAVLKGNAGTQAAQAAARIDVVLEDQPLAAAGFNWMSTAREERVRITEVDDLDPSIRWQHWGGHYRIEMSVTGM